MGRSTTGIPNSSLASWSTVRRVMPSRMFSVTDGVISTPSRTMNTFSALPSEIWPSLVSTSASSNPANRASDLMNAEFT